MNLLTQSDQILRLLSLMTPRRLARSLAGPRYASAVLSTQLMEMPLYVLVLSSELTMSTGWSPHFFYVHLCLYKPTYTDISQRWGPYAGPRLGR